MVGPQLRRDPQRRKEVIFGFQSLDLKVGDENEVIAERRMDVPFSYCTVIILQGQNVSLGLFFKTTSPSTTKENQKQRRGALGNH